MKILKIKSLVVCLVVAALCCTFTCVCFAEEATHGEQAKNFVCSAEFAPSENSLTLYFGASDAADNWRVTADKTASAVTLSRVTAQGETALKTASVSVQSKLILVVNEGVAKVFADDSNVAVLVCKLTDYTGGEAGYVGSAVNVQFARTDSSEGDFCCAYAVQKVINVTDGHAKLGDGDYSVQKGVLTLSPAYLQTLEAGVDYTFRAVTDFTDFDFMVTADFASVTVSPSLEKFYRGNDVVLEMGGSATVSKVTVDGAEVPSDGFTQQDGRVVISASALEGVASGKHSVKLFTDRGRPTAEFNLADAVQTITEMEEKATHVFFWIDISIFGALVVGYVVFVVIKKLKKN